MQKDKPSALRKTVDTAQVVVAGVPLIGGLALGATGLLLAGPTLKGIQDYKEVSKQPDATAKRRLATKATAETVLGLPLLIASVPFLAAGVLLSGAGHSLEYLFKKSEHAVEYLTHVKQRSQAVDGGDHKEMVRRATREWLQANPDKVKDPQHFEEAVERVMCEQVDVDKSM